jgi:hypothetical protein
VNNGLALSPHPSLHGVSSYDSASPTNGHNAPRLLLGALQRGTPGFLGNFSDWSVGRVRISRRRYWRLLCKGKWAVSCIFLSAFTTLNRILWNFLHTSRTDYVPRKARYNFSLCQTTRNENAVQVDWRELCVFCTSLLATWSDCLQAAAVLPPVEPVWASESVWTRGRTFENFWSVVQSDTKGNSSFTFMYMQDLKWTKVNQNEVPLTIFGVYFRYVILYPPEENFD